MWEAANWTLGMPLFSPPGERFFYSNPAYWLLTAIVEKVSCWGRGASSAAEPPALPAPLCLAHQLLPATRQATHRAGCSLG